MKVSSSSVYLAVVAVSTSTASAFVPSSSVLHRNFGIVTTRSSSSLGNSRVDSSEAIKAALEASQKYGPTSAEARVAWDIVEEMDASDNSNAYSGGTANTEDDKEYNEKVQELAALLEEQKAKVEKVKTLAQEIQAVKLAKPTVTASADSPAMRQALANAREATEKHGSESKEAALAWEALEEIASSDYSEATKGSLDDECLVETIDACEAMAELSRAINVASNKDQGRYSG